MKSNEPIQNICISSTAVCASVLSVLQDGKSVEAGLTGREGFVGVPVVAGFKSSPTRVIMQIEGSGYRILPKDLLAALKTSPPLERSLLKYSQELALQASQIAALQSRARSGRAPSSLAAHEPGPDWRSTYSADAGISRPHARYAAGQRHRRRGHAAKSRIDQLRSRTIEDRRPRPP